MFTPLRRLALLLSCAAALFAQVDANKGQIVGTVLDPNGAAVPNAKINVRNTATGFARDLTSNEAGQYRVVSIDPGSYTLTASSAGFAEAKIEGLVVTVGSALSLNVTLSVQATSTVIEVGESFISDVQTSPSATINSTAITNLPINGRRFQDFATLTPNVLVEPSRSQLSFAGQRGIYSNVMLDGGDYNQPFFGGIRGGERSNSIITVPQSAVQEFQVVTTGYSPEYGRSTGGIMNTITKSGANDVHGQAFWQIRPVDLSGENPVRKIKPSEDLQQWGGAIGGPIKRDRLFWFGAYEQQRATIERTVFFAQLQGVTPVATSQEAFNYYKSLEGPFSPTNRAFATMGRLDYQFAAGHRLTARYNFSDAVEKLSATVGGALLPLSNQALSNEGDELDTIHNGALQFTALLSPSVVNDFRFIGSAEVRPRLANSATPTVSNAIGAFGTRSFLPTTQSDKRWQFADSLSVTKGKHTMKIGGDYNYLTAAQTFGFNQFGAFGFNTTNVATLLDIMSVGGTIANRFDSPNVSYSRQIGDLAAAFNMHQIAFFAQDSWRLHPQFSLDFGLRYETQVNPGVEANNASLVDRVRGFRFPIGYGVDVTDTPARRNQWMPRMGFAWTPFTDGGRTVVRGHYGVFYASTPLLSFAGPNNNFRTPPGDVSISIPANSAVNVYNAFLQAGVNLNSSQLGSLPIIPIETVQRAAQIALGGNAPDPFRGVSVTTMADDFRNPRSQQAGLGFETELVKNFLMGVQMNYVNTVNLMRNRDYNLPIPTIRAGDLSQRPFYGVPATRPISTLTQVTVRESSARQMYRAATLQAQYRRKDFQFSAYYTLAENFDDDSNERDTGGNSIDNNFNLRPEYAYSNLDRRHQFVMNGIWTMPFGFELSGIYRANSGRPLNATAGSDVNLDGSTSDRPYRGPGDPMPRNAFRNRPFRTIDLRVMKSFSFKDRYRIQLSAEMFNFADWDNVEFGRTIYGQGYQANGTFAPIDASFMRLRLPNGDYDTNNNQVGLPRQVQFGLRFFF